MPTDPPPPSQPDLPHGERQQLVERLLACEARYDAHFEHAPIGLLEADAETERIVSVNASLVELVGYTREDLVGLRLRHVTHPEHRSQDRSKLDRAIRERSSLVIEETRWLTKLGEPAWVRIEGTLVLVGEGLRLLAIVHDIAERRAQRLALEAAVNDRNELLAMLGHQLRNRLAAITNACHLLSLGADEPHTLDRARDVIERHTDATAKLLDSLQDVVRLAQGADLDLSLEAIELGRFVGEIVDDYRDAIARREVGLELELPEQPLWIRGDRERLVQALRHLIANALEVTPARGTVAVHVGWGDDEAVISVSDTGRGLLPSEREKAFDPFRNVARRLEVGAEGLGVGLPLAHGIVAHHGGTLTLHSRGRDHGTQAMIRLPLGEAPASSRRAPTGDGPGEAARRILLVEDDRDTAESTQTLLDLAGHEVAVAGDGDEALQMARQLWPDVVLCDIALRGEKNGYDVARALRRLDREREPGTGSMKLVAVTGYSRPEDRQRAYRAGFDGFVVKPLNIKELSKLVNHRSEPRSSRAGA